MEVAEAVERCVKQLEDVERRQAARLAREQAREAERLKAREHALQQLKERQEPALKPMDMEKAQALEARGLSMTAELKKSAGKTWQSANDVDASAQGGLGSLAGAAMRGPSKSALRCQCCTRLSIDRTHCSHEVAPSARRTSVCGGQLTSKQQPTSGAGGRALTRVTS